MGQKDRILVLLLLAQHIVSESNIVVTLQLT